MGVLKAYEEDLIGISFHLEYGQIKSKDTLKKTVAGNCLHNTTG